MRVLVIYNPVAGSKWQRFRLNDIEHILSQNHIPFVTQVTCRSGDATRWAQSARDEGYTHVLVFGGDGTIREAAQALAGADVILVPFPIGTANLLAHEFGLVPALPLVPRLFAEGVVRHVDLGRLEATDEKGEVRSAYFVLMAGVGIDALAVGGVDTRLKRWLGWMLYLWSGFWHAIRHKPFRVTIQYADPGMPPLKTKAWVVVIGNARAYGLKGVRVATRARMDDGLLDICVFRSRSLWQFLNQFVKVLRGRHLEDKRILYCQARSFRLETDRAMPVQLDGDLFGETPIRVSIAPRVLKILLPPLPESESAGKEPVEPLTASRQR